jgi:bisphosphoglycerate-independent phosphoglycerate mutase (AlkP superfamily)
LALAALGQRPRLMLIAFPAVDEFGHYGTFEEYLGAIRRVDVALWQLWNALQADPFYAGQTTLFITNDHGRRLDDFRTHGGSTHSERHVTLLTLGPGTPAGVQVSRRRMLVDIAPTVGRLLGFHTPLARGSIMWELIQQ